MTHPAAATKRRLACRRAPHCLRVVAMALSSMLLAAPAAWAQQSAPAANPLRIGVVGPLTGGSADFGQVMLHGVQLAADEINAVGGYLGRKIELVVKDDTGDNDTGLKVSQELAREKVLATIGFCNTGVAAKSLDVFQGNHIPLIIPCATGTVLTAKYPGKDSYIFRDSPRDLIQAPFVVDDLMKRGLTRVALFADTTGYGEGGMNDVIKALAARKLKPVYVARFPLGVKDVSEDMRAARAAGANVIFAYTVGPELAVIAKSRDAVGWRVPHVGPWPLSFPNFIKAAGKSAEGALMSQTFIAEPSNERRAAFLAAYDRKFASKHIPVPMAAAQAYDATYLLLYALFQIGTGEINGPALKHALENIDRPYYGVVTTYDHPFSVNDKDAITRNMLVMGVVRNGLVTYAYPEDAKSSGIVQRKQ